MQFLIDGFVSGAKDDAVINNITDILEKFIPWEVRNASTPSEMFVRTEKIKHFYFKETNTFLQRIRSFVSVSYT